MCCACASPACARCRDTPKLSADELQRHMPALPAWALDDAGTSIGRSFTSKHFVAAIAFFNAVKDVAESEGHHPDLHLTDYRSVRVVVSTHAVGGLTIFDLILASKLDEVDVEYSPKWLREREAQAQA
jgi:4a-hydroxytetrahydrobiopterin dehydratase